MNLEEKIDAAIAAGPKDLETELMAQKEYRRDLWESYGPGKYDNWATAYADEFVQNGFASEEIGDVETTNAYSLLRGEFNHPSLKGKVGAILEYTDQGFVYGEFFSSEKALEKKWAKVEKFVSDNAPGGED